MHLEKLQLVNFRNYENHFFEFSSGLNCIIGKNGSGKTNLLDAIYYLSLSKSFIHNQDHLNIRFEKENLLIEGIYISESKELITSTIQKGGKKLFFQDKNIYERIGDHIGKYPIVLIAPDDTDLIRDSSETRRKLFDGILAQTDATYLKLYQKYNRILDQRNGLLKQFAEHNYFDEDLLKIYSEQLLAIGIKIYSIRKEFMLEFIPIFQKHYRFLSEANEQVQIEYSSEVADEQFPIVFLKNIGTDLAAQRTTKGVHKDDYFFYMDKLSIKKFGSQGQKKSFIMAIKLAQFDIIEKIKGIKPILLLDDIFDKLDEKRINKLVEMIKAGIFSQVFITDARPSRTKDLLFSLKFPVNYIETEILEPGI